MKRDRVWMAGQRMIAGFSGPVIPAELRRAIQENKIGNIILFRENIESAAQVRALCQELRALILEETGLPPLIALDQEGGVVSRMPPDGTVTPTAMALTAAGSLENARLAGEIIGRELRALGVNLDFAPVMDVNSNPHNPVIGARSFGDTPETVSAFGTAMLRGIQAGGALACAKHFPGHGDTAVDSHLGLPTIDKTLAELEECELIPFRAAIEAGVDAVMTSHILFPQIEAEVPATLSRRIITDLLRKHLGFSGIIVSDCMMMKAVSDRYGVVAGSVAACHAGVDLICISHSPQLAREACAAMAESADADEMAASVERIIRRKASLPGAEDAGLIGCPAHRQAVEEMRLQSITHLGAPLPPLGDRPVFLGCCPFQASLVNDPRSALVSFPRWMEARLGGMAMETSADPGAEEIAKAVALAKQGTSIALCTYNGHMRPGQLELMRALGRLHLPLICAALRDPYDLAHLPKDACGLAVYEYSKDSLAALEKVLRGDEAPKGKCPVRLEAEA